VLQIATPMGEHSCTFA